AAPASTQGLRGSAIRAGDENAAAVRAPVLAPARAAASIWDGSADRRGLGRQRRATRPRRHSDAAGGRIGQPSDPKLVDEKGTEGLVEALAWLGAKKTALLAS